MEKMETASVSHRLAGFGDERQAEQNQDWIWIRETIGGYRPYTVPEV